MILTNTQAEEWLRKLTRQFGQPFFIHYIEVQVQRPNGSLETVKLEAPNVQA